MDKNIIGWALVIIVLCFGVFLIIEMTEPLREDIFCIDHGYDYDMFRSGVKYCKSITLHTEEATFQEVKDGAFGSRCDSYERCWKKKEAF